MRVELHSGATTYLVTAEIDAHGSGALTVRRDGVVLGAQTWDEGKPRHLTPALEGLANHLVGVFRTAHAAAIRAAQRGAG